MLMCLAEAKASIVQALCEGTSAHWWKQQVIPASFRCLSFKIGH